jgi:acetylornithine deacetylase/succinyl-diaminopimelate desuccinylase-like protein
MIFVRSQNGSHNLDEAMRMEDFDAACRVLMAWTLAAAG